MSTIAKLTLDQYDRMIAAGIFDPGNNSVADRPKSVSKQRVELIHGELRDMTPIGPLHEELVDLLARWSFEVTRRDVVRVRVQNSLGLPELDSAPEPDVVWVKERSYAKERPTAEDVLLIIEVADSSLDYDRGEKAELYASAGIKDYWVVNVPAGQLEVFRESQNGRYSSHQILRGGDTLRPLAQPDVALALTQLFSS